MLHETIRGDRGQHHIRRLITLAVAAVFVVTQERRSRPSFTLPARFLESLANVMQHGGHVGFTRDAKGQITKVRLTVAPPTPPTRNNAESEQGDDRNFNWPWWIRTTINGSKVRCPAIGRRATEHQNLYRLRAGGRPGQGLDRNEGAVLPPEHHPGVLPVPLGAVHRE